MRLVFQFCLHFLVCYGVFGQKGYPIENLDPMLKKHSNAVIRVSERTFSSYEDGKGSLKVKQVLTVLNSEGDRYASLVVPFDSFSTVKGIKGKLYNREGKLQKTFRRSDMYDYPSMASFSLYEDNRVLAYSPRSQMSYPFTIEWEYEINFSSLLYAPTWVVQEAPDIAIEKSEFTLEFRQEYPIKYKTLNLEQPEETKADGTTIVKWTVEKLPSISKDYDFEVLGTRRPIVYSAPEIINLGGNVSNNLSWIDFGNWFYNLNEGRDSLGMGGVQKVEEILGDSQLSDSDKVKRVYSYLQENTRYVNISLGIGGFQSFPATVVDEVGYGDCKALTTYTKGMLKSAGIKSNYVLIRAGRKKAPFRRDFPSSQFNHVILAVPMEYDTVWLECTSQDNAFDFLGSFTDGREALWIEKDNSQVVRTPRYGIDENKEERSINIAINDDGSAVGKAAVKFSGLRTELNGLKWAIKEGEEEQKRWINQYFSIPNSEVLSFEFETHKTPTIDLVITLSITNFVQRINKDLLISHLFDLQNDSKTYAKKEGPFVVQQAYQIIESVKVEFPEEYNPVLMKDI